MTVMNDHETDYMMKSPGNELGPKAKIFKIWSSGGESVGTWRRRLFVLRRAVYDGGCGGRQEVNHAGVHVSKVVPNERQQGTSQTVFSRPHLLRECALLMMMM